MTLIRSASQNIMKKIFLFNKIESWKGKPLEGEAKKRHNMSHIDPSTSCVRCDNAYLFNKNLLLAITNKFLKFPRLSYLRLRRVPASTTTTKTPQKLLPQTANKVARGEDDNIEHIMYR
jgi:hypothetical protein